MNKLHTTYLGLKINSPIIAASSGLTESLDHLKAFEDAGAGAVVLKSIFEEEIIREVENDIKKAAYDRFIYPETLEYYDNIETGGISSENYLKLITDAKAALKIPVIASINCVSSKEWTYFPRVIERAGADALELNLFVLPTDLNRSAEENESIYFDIIREVKSKLTIPIAVKISPYFSNLAQILKKIDDSGVKGIVLFNKFFNPDIDINEIKVTNGYVLSQSSDISLSLRWIAIMANRLNCDLAASTGITDGKSAIKQILAGAQTIQAASVFYRNGIEYLKTMNADIEKWMTEKHFKTIDDFRGKLSQEKSNDPAAYERVQFMKYFRAYPNLK
jgi:dihydroorotate dehydrogenase (fumarate)